MGVFLPIAALVVAYVATAVVVIEAIITLYWIAIVAAIIAVAATALATYYYIEGDLQNSLLFSGIAIAAGIGGVYATYIMEAETASALMAEGTAEAIAEAEAIQNSYTFTIVGYADAVYTSWKSIAEALHLGLLAKIHQVAYLVSEDYRQAFDEVFWQISKVGMSLNWGPIALNLLFENARTLVLDVSSSLGENYDIGQIKWLSTFNEYLKEFNKNWEYYRAKPGRFITWIADNTYRPAIDAKATTVRAIFEGIESALGLIQVTAEDITKLKNDTLKLVGDLPEVLRNKIEPQLRQITDAFDDFVKLQYDPALKIINGSLEILGVDVDKNKQEARAIVQRLIRPGKYLAEINELDETARREDEDMVADISTRKSKRETEDVSQGWINPLKDGFKEITLHESRPPAPAPDFLKLEKAPELKKEGIEERNTPFVGDY